MMMRGNDPPKITTQIKAVGSIFDNIFADRCINLTDDVPDFELSNIVVVALCTSNTVGFSDGCGLNRSIRTFYSDSPLKLF